MADQKPKFRDELDKFAKSHFGEGIAKLNETQRSDALVLCYLLQIRNVLLPGSVPDDFEELQNYICDAQYDRTVDFLYRDDNGHVTLIQAKHRNPNRDESEADFDSFRMSLRKLCPKTRPQGAKINQKVLDLASDVDWEEDTFTLIFLSLARHSVQISKNAELDLENVQDSPLADIGDRAELVYLSEDEINKQWRDVIGHNTGVMPSVEIPLVAASGDSPRVFVYESEAGTKSFIGLLASAQIHQLYNRYRERLFNLNIRNYIGDTRTNKDIIKSAASDSDNFFFYNNGISAVATSVSILKVGEAVTLSCKNFSVINGAQTFRSISKAYTRSEALTAKNLRVLLRVSEIDFRKDKDAEMLDRITRYNNTQNSMKLSDFRSNDPVQQSLARYVAEVGAFEGKRYEYRNKRTQASDRNKIPIKMDDFSRSVYAYQFGPIDVFGGQSYLYDTSADGGYVKLFGKDLGALSEAEFERLFGIWLLTANVDAQLKLEKARLAGDLDEFDLLRKKALERKFLTFFALGEVIREVCKLRGIEEGAVLRTFSKPRWQSESSKAEFVKEAFAIAMDMVVQAYQIAEKGAGFVHRNFFRDAETLSHIRSARASRKGQLQKLSEGAPLK